MCTVCFVLSDGIHAKPKTQRPDSAGSGSVSVFSIGQVPGLLGGNVPFIETRVA